MTFINFTLSINTELSYFNRSHCAQHNRLLMNKICIISDIHKTINCLIITHIVNQGQSEWKISA